MINSHTLILITVSPLGNVAKLETSEFDVNMPKSEFASVSSIIVDGFDGIEVKTDSSYEKLDVFTVNDREYFLKLGTVELPKVTVNYYLQMVKN